MTVSEDCQPPPNSCLRQRQWNGDGSRRGAGSGLWIVQSKLRGETSGRILPQTRRLPGSTSCGRIPVIGQLGSRYGVAQFLRTRCRTLNAEPSSATLPLFWLSRTLCSPLVSYASLDPTQLFWSRQRRQFGRRRCCPSSVTHMPR